MKKVLIADDEPNIVLSLEFLMRKDGYEVQVARTGDDALRLMESFRPDAVVLDVMMPGKSGYEVCRRIREDAHWRSVKILMLTARGGEAEIRKGIDAGADAYLTKPFATQQVIAEMRKLLEPAP